MRNICAAVIWLLSRCGDFTRKPLANLLQSRSNWDRQSASRKFQTKQLQWRHWRHLCNDSSQVILQFVCILCITFKYTCNMFIGRMHCTSLTILLQAVMYVAIYACSATQALLKENITLVEDSKGAIAAAKGLANAI